MNGALQRATVRSSRRSSPRACCAMCRCPSTPPGTSGGPADLFFVPRDIMDLAAFIRQLPPELPLLWVGLGSNLLVRDGGVRGAVVSTHGALGALERSAPRASTPGPACPARASPANA